MIDKAWESCQFSEKVVYVTRVIRATKKKRCYAVEIEITRRLARYRETESIRTLFWCAADDAAPAQTFLNRLNPGWAIETLTGE
jgi:hypothetical protein